MYKQIILNAVNKYLNEAATVNDESIKNSIFKALSTSGFDIVHSGSNCEAKASQESIDVNQVHHEAKVSSVFNCIQCLGIDDNTLNGIDTKKISWRAYFVNVRTEEDFFIEIKAVDSKSYEICCLVFDENDDLKPIYKLNSQKGV